MYFTLEMCTKRRIFSERADKLLRYYVIATINDNLNLEEDIASLTLRETLYISRFVFLTCCWLSLTMAQKSTRYDLAGSNDPKATIVKLNDKSSSKFVRIRGSISEMNIDIN